MEDVLLEELNIKKNKKLTVAIPIRVSDYEYMERLSYIANDPYALSQSSIEFMVVDDGSKGELSERIKSICKENNFSYIKLGTEEEEFSVGRCRNYAALVSLSKFIMFQDVDLVPTEGFYQGVLDEIDIQGLESNAAKFLMFGVIYLTQNASKEFFEVPFRKQKPFCLQKYIEADKDYIEKFSTGTSVNLYNRLYFLNKGGNDDDFEGWGFEDLEFNNRCIRDLRIFPLPKDWLVDYKNFSSINTFRGWKSVYRLFGDMTFIKGLVLFHIWHPVESRSDYMLKREENKKLFNDKLKDYANNKKQPSPIENIHKGVTLVFRENAFVSSRDIHGFLGKIILRSEHDFSGERDFLDYLSEKKVDRVLFHNPYVNESMIDIYGWCRENEVNYIVAERGALPGSIFFDSRGFNFDSESYSPSYWDKEYSGESQKLLKDYVSKVKSGQSYLEEQSKRTSGARVKQKLGIHKSKKVLFVPFQRPEDTVITCFAEDDSFNEFVCLVKNVSSSLKRDWTVVYKKHPLEDESYDVGNAICADNENICDLIEASDAVALINSGCGVLGMLWEKPVFCYGDAFYNHDGIARKIENSNELVQYLESGWKPDSVKINKFLNYLVNEFYSFGKMVTKKTMMPDGKRMTATVDIEYNVVRGLDNEDFWINRFSKPRISWGSPLFDRYTSEPEKPTATPVSVSSNNPLGKPQKKQNYGSDVLQRQQEKRLSLSARRWRKFKKKPVAFFLDSQHSPLQYFGKALQKVKN